MTVATATVYLTTFWFELFIVAVVAVNDCLPLPKTNIPMFYHPKLSGNRLYRRVRSSAQRSRPYGFLLMALLKVLSSLQLTVVVTPDAVSVHVRPLPTPVVKTQPPTQLPQ